MVVKRGIWGRPVAYLGWYLHYWIGKILVHASNDQNVAVYIYRKNHSFRTLPSRGPGTSNLSNQQCRTTVSAVRATADCISCISLIVVCAYLRLRSNFGNVDKPRSQFWQVVHLFLIVMQYIYLYILPRYSCSQTIC